MTGIRPAPMPPHGLILLNGQCHHIGTYGSKEQAQTAYETAMHTENPDFDAAPESGRIA